MTEPSRSSGTPTEDVLYAIQEAIDAPRLPFLDRNLRRGVEPDGLEARVTKLEAVIEFQRNIAEIKSDLQIIRANARSDFRRPFAAIMAAAFGLACALGKVF